MTRAAILIPLVGLCSCASGALAQPRAAYSAARLLPKAAAGANPDAAEARDAKSGERRKRKVRAGSFALASVSAANRGALQEPSRNSFMGAVQLYAWTEGGLYRLYTAPEEVSDIALQRGENLVSVAAGDTARWVIGDTNSGSGAERRTHVLVKPSAAGLVTNLVIATDRRIYHLELQSSSKGAMAAISWTYPEDPLLALKGTPAAGASVSPDVQVEALNFDYRIEGDRPAWRPTRAFDDGRQVFIEFPPSVSEGEAPPLFVTGKDGRAELVNYRIRGRYYVVDQLFAAAELRLGKRRQQVVRIVRENALAGRARKPS
jgi:type IV secretion system protein VirB9